MFDNGIELESKPNVPTDSEAEESSRKFRVGWVPAARKTWEGLRSRLWPNGCSPLIMLVIV